MLRYWLFLLRDADYFFLCEVPPHKARKREREMQCLVPLLDVFFLLDNSFNQQFIRWLMQVWRDDFICQPPLLSGLKPRGMIRLPIISLAISIGALRYYSFTSSWTMFFFVLVGVTRGFAFAFCDLVSFGMVGRANWWISFPSMTTIGKVNQWLKWHARRYLKILARKPCWSSRKTRWKDQAYSLSSYNTSHKN